MQKATIPAPGWFDTERMGPWELDGLLFGINDGLRGRERELLARRMNAILVRQSRLQREGRSIYEDAEAAVLMADQFEACRKCVLRVEREGKELSAGDLAELLDGLGILARDELCEAVVAANSLGRKNA